MIKTYSRYLRYFCVVVEKSLLHNEERVLGLQYNTRCVLENWGGKRVNTNAQWTIYLTDPHASLWWLHLSSVIPLFQSMVFPVVAAVQYILSSCHLALFLTTGDLYDLLSFYTNDRWVLYHQNVRHILWVASVQSRQMSILIWSWYLLLLNYVSCQMLCGYFDIRLVVFIKIIWSQYSPH